MPIVSATNSGDIVEHFQIGSSVPFRGSVQNTPHIVIVQWRFVFSSVAIFVHKLLFILVGGSFVVAVYK